MGEGVSAMAVIACCGYLSGLAAALFGAYAAAARPRPRPHPVGLGTDVPVQRRVVDLTAPDRNCRR
jgi:hypothetical protein